MLGNEGGGETTLDTVVVFCGTETGSDCLLRWSATAEKLPPVCMAGALPCTGLAMLLVLLLLGACLSMGAIRLHRMRKRRCRSPRPSHATWPAPQRKARLASAAPRRSL
jgi:hypothetical protein